jgi:autotransporter-associated beta strand protein
LYSGLTAFGFHSAADGSSLGADAPSWLVNMIQALSGPEATDITGTGSPHAASGLAGGTLNPAFDGGALKMDTAQGAYAQNFTLSANGGTIDQNGNASTFSGVISDAAAGGGTLTIANSGTGGSVTLTGVNTYVGATTIDSGVTLALAGDGSIASSSKVTDNGTFDISGTTHGASIQSLAGTGNVALGGQTLTLSHANDTFSGAIAGSGGVTVNGGTETLSGANTYTGATTIGSEGTLALSGTGSIASSSKVTDNGTFDISGTTNGASIQSLAATMTHFGVVNRVVADASLLDETLAFAQKAAHGPTRAYAAHKALLRAWAVGGVSAADEAMFDIAMPLFETDDARRGINSAVDALKAGRPRPALDFKGG